jgi:hypothetical protein
MPVARVMTLVFIAVATTHGTSATAIMPERMASGGEPYWMLCQNSGRGRKQ